MLTPEVAYKDEIPQKFGVYELVLGLSADGRELLASFEAPPSAFFLDPNVASPVESKVRNVGLVPDPEGRRTLKFLTFLGRLAPTLEDRLSDAVGATKCDKTHDTKCDAVARPRQAGPTSR